MKWHVAGWVLLKIIQASIIAFHHSIKGRMVKIIFLFATLLSANVLNAQTTYTTHHGVATLFAPAPRTSLNAKNEKVIVEFNTETETITVLMEMKDFQFRSHRMQRDAKRKYLETHEYPVASFKGKIDCIDDYTIQGTYSVTATGTLRLHGTEQLGTRAGVVVIGQGQIQIKSEFKVYLEDFKIATPTILGRPMTADFVLLKIDATLFENPDLSSRK